MKLKRMTACVTALTLMAFSVFPGGGAVVQGLTTETDGTVEVGSMLPLEERSACLVMDQQEGIDLSAVPVELVLDRLLDVNGAPIEIADDAKVVWSYYKDKQNNVISDDYFVLEEGGTLDLSLFAEYDQYVLEMIVGNGKQLDPDNVRYIVTVYLSDALNEMRTYSLYTQDADGTRHEVVPKSVSVQDSAVNVGTLSFSVRQFLVPDHTDGTEYYLGVDSMLADHPFIRLDVLTYAEYFKYMQAQAQGTEYAYNSISSQMLNQDMRQKDKGFRDQFLRSNADVLNETLNNALFFLYVNEKTGEVLSQDFVKFIVDDSNSYFTDEVSDKTADGWQDVKLQSEIRVAAPSDFTLVGNRIQDVDALLIDQVWLKEGYAADAEYNYQLNAHSRIWDNANAHVVKAVVGNYDTLSEAEQAEDIKEQLIPAETTDTAHGYRANYSGDGMLFTVFFDDDSSFRFCVVFEDYDPAKDTDYIREYSNVPVIGEADPWFRITGASDAQGNVLDTYVVENGKSINVDTMYGYGYQTVFFNGNVNSFAPTFWLANEEKVSVESIYVNGRKFAPGDTISFADGETEINAIFSVIILDSNGKHTKNYTVSFVKKASGPKLYVAGPSSPEVRSVFLDEYFEYKHDIFIANVGDAPLTDLRLELDAAHVALDPYWTVGGEGNDTLAPCPDDFGEEMLASEYGELSNVGKIRLIPDGEESGEINGTLKIYSGDELLSTILLSGQAQDPQILTTELDDAVKYVPYSYLVTTSNMYDWTATTFTWSGTLPEGVTFYPETGEIYGVPQETGTFTFDVTADFTSETYDFAPSTVSLTLTVADNTNYNVYTATDEGYTILDAIGTDAGGYDHVLDGYADTLFRSEGVLEQFVDLWLNGERLVNGVDYLAESGSTKITIYAQTFENKADKEGVNTIAAEFRTKDTGSLNTLGNTNELKRTAQNFRLSTTEETQKDEVKVTIRVKDASGNAVSGLTLELHSDPQTGVTDATGTVGFQPIAFGEHTLYAKDASGKTTAQWTFQLVSGKEQRIDGNTVTAVKGGSVLLEMVYTGTGLDKPTLVSENSSDTEADATAINPDTGDAFALWRLIAFVSSLLIGSASFLPRKRKNR